MADAQTATFGGEKPDLIQSLIGRDAATPLPSSITAAGKGGKFSPKGETLFHPGNTFICHIEQTSDFFLGLRAYQEELAASEFRSRYALLSPNSFHMTIFCGVSGVPLGADGWPEGYAQDMSLDDITTRFAEQLLDWRGAITFTVASDGFQKPATIAMKPATSKDSEALWDARSRLRDLTGLRRSDHADYRFHVSLAYQIAWFTPAEAEKLVALSTRLYDKYLADIGPIRLGPIEFCRFETMQRFDPLMCLSNDSA